MLAPMAKLPTWVLLIIVVGGGLEIASGLFAWAVLGEEFPALRMGFAALAILVFGPQLHARLRQWDKDGGRINWHAVVWPVRSNPNPTAVVWIGRVLHWLSVAFAIFFGGAMILMALVRGFGVLGVAMALVGVLPMAFFGRGARFVLAKE